MSPSTRSPANGAKLVARAWVDPAFKARLIADPKAACAEMGIDATASLLKDKAGFEIAKIPGEDKIDLLDYVPNISKAHA